MKPNDTMTVAELIEELQKLPPDGKVYYSTYEYRGATAPLQRVSHYPESGMGMWANTVILE